MTPGQIKRLMSSKGFVLKRQGGRHAIYTDGFTTIPVSRGTTRSVRNQRNIIAEIERAVKNRPKVVEIEALPKEEKEVVDITRFNIGRQEAMPAPGALIKPQPNGHDPKPEEAVKRTKYDGITRRRIESRVIELYNNGAKDVNSLHRALIGEGIMNPDGVNPIGSDRVRYFMNTLLEAGIIKQVIVPPRPDAGPMSSAHRKPGRLPDTIMGILTDPELTAEQKIRMISAYAEV